jgi:hypothetical protein
MAWMGRKGARAACLAVLCLMGAGVQAGMATSQPVPAVVKADFADARPSEDARRVAEWAFEHDDAKGRPVAVVDKRNARIYVFGADGRLRGSTAVLLGLAKGDKSAPGIGEMAGGYIPAGLRTTPAGRFDSEPGHNAKGEAIVWVDYDAAFAIHRLRPAPAAERRPARLFSDTPDDNRISQGCVIVPGNFFDQVITPTLGRQRGVVYVLPDAEPESASLQVAGNP